MTDVSQSTEYFLILPAKPDLKLKQLAMIGLLKMPLSILIANHDERKFETDALPVIR